MLTKLLFRTLPQHYPAGSAYAHFPFLVPSRMRSAMEARGTAGAYTWDRPAAVAPKGSLSGSEVFPRTREAYEVRVKELVGVQGPMTSEVCVRSVLYPSSWS